MSVPNESNDEQTPAGVRSFRALLDATPDATLLFDRRGRVVTSNSEAANLFGYARDELSGLSVEDLVPQRYHAAHRRHLQTLGEVPGAHGLRLRLAVRRKDGNEFSADVSVVPVVAGDGSGWVLVALRDVDDHARRGPRESKEGTLEAGEPNTTLLANAVHELRTPLTVVMGLTQLLYDEEAGALNARQKDYLANVLASAQHLNTLVNGMLDLARVQAGKMSFAPAAFSLRQLMEDVRSAVQVLAARKHHVLTLDVEPGLDVVTTDALKLKQVLLNFGSNAVKFTPEHGAIALRARHEGKRAFRVEVEDTGVGIPEHQRHKLFVEFQRLDPGPLGPQEGTGLGLALSKRIVEALGGQIGVSSVMGKGSVFWAVLPLQIGKGVHAHDVSCGAAIRGEPD